MKNAYTIGFAWEPTSKEDDGWNGIASIWGLKEAKKLAAEIEAEYGEKPEIRKMT